MQYRVANPGPLGLYAFGYTTALLQVRHQWRRELRSCRCCKNSIMLQEAATGISEVMYIQSFSDGFLKACDILAAILNINSVKSCHQPATWMLIVYKEKMPAQTLVHKSLSVPFELCNSTARCPKACIPTFKLSWLITQGFNTRWVEKGTNDMVYCHALFLGGLTQLLAGMWGES